MKTNWRNRPRGPLADRLFFIAFLYLVLSGAYLGAFAAPSLSYIGTVLLHLMVGALSVPLLLVAGWRHVRKSNLSDGRRWVAVAAVILSLGAATSGVGLMTIGALRAHGWLVQVHIGSSIAAFLGLMLYLRLGTREAREKPSPAGGGWRRACLAAELAAVAAIIIYGGIRYHVRHHSDFDDRIVNPRTVPIEMSQEAMGGETGPFFPSSAHTTTGGRIPSNFFMESTSKSCARSGCHPDIYEQWYASAHHFSSFNNQWYRKAIEYMQEMVGPQPSKWCGGCHDPAVLFNGMMDTPIQEIIDRPEAQAGLGCTACHSIVRVRSTMGQGDYLIEYPPLHDLAVSENLVLRTLHDYLTRVQPEPHRRLFLKPFHREQSAEFCATCHKVHLDVPVNNYRWFRGFNEYDNWQASGVSGQGARSFYYPPQPLTCVSCHMPLVPSADQGSQDGLVHSHRFPAANTALPVANEDTKQLEITKRFLTANRVTLDLFALAEPAPSGAVSAPPPGSEPPELSTFFAVGEEQADAVGTRTPSPVEVIRVHAPLDRLGAVATAGESIRLDLVVRSRDVGHFFPGGTVDAFDVWTELKVVDANGKIIFWSGFVEDKGNGPVDPSAHFYRSLMLDGNGNPINKRNAWAARAIVYVNLIPPGAADTVHYRLDIPPDAAPPLHLSASLNYRKFNWWNTQWAFAGVRDPTHPSYASGKDYDDGNWVFEGDLSKVSGKLKEIPVLPIITLARAETHLEIRQPDAPFPSEEVLPQPQDRERWNDYGIGLLRQGDLRGAEAAFLMVTQIDPSYADGWLNVARSRIAEGNLEGAQTMLDRALEEEPALARSHYFQGVLLKARGEYEEALKFFGMARKDFPRDRVVLNQIGRVLFLQEKHEEAIAELQKVLEIDPEDLQAHYTLMLAYRARGQADEADRERTLYLRFKADESSQEITGPYRREHSHDNNERQRVHEHISFYPTRAESQESEPAIGTR